MFVRLLMHLRGSGLKIGLGEWLGLLDALRADLIDSSVDEFYALARLCLCKDESQFDRFDRAFGDFVRGSQRVAELVDPSGLPEDWLRQQAERLFTDEERARIESMGGWDALMKALRERLEEQKAAHRGGNRWIGTGGTSPFGNGGYNPEGVRIGGTGRFRSAVKVWDQREFRNFDDNVEIGTRQIKIALRGLRRFARAEATDELDLDSTIAATARNAGWLDLRNARDRHNAVKLLLFLDVGGSMDDHVRVVEELFSAARSEFKHLETFYFHNFLYERVWKDNQRRYRETTPTLDLIHRFGRDYRIVFVGDASMSPYEILQPGGSIEHWNEEAGAVWLGRMLQTWPRAVWINPVPREHWGYTQSIQITRQLIGERMYGLTLQGLTEGIRALSTQAAPVSA